MDNYMWRYHEGDTTTSKLNTLPISWWASSSAKFYLVFVCCNCYIFFSQIWVGAINFISTSGGETKGCVLNMGELRFAKEFPNICWYCLLLFYLHSLSTLQLPSRSRLRHEVLVVSVWIRLHKVCGLSIARCSSCDTIQFVSHYGCRVFCYAISWQLWFTACELIIPHYVFLCVSFSEYNF